MLEEHASKCSPLLGRPRCKYAITQWNLGFDVIPHNPAKKGPALWECTQGRETLTLTLSREGPGGGSGDGDFRGVPEWADPCEPSSAPAFSGGVYLTA